MDTPQENGFPGATALPPSLTRVAARQPLVRLLSLLGCLAGILVLFVFDPSRHGFYPFCTFYRTTGLLCPGCGCLRAMHHLLHGEVIAALRCNVLLILSLPLLAGYVLRRMLNPRRGTTQVLTVHPVWLWCALGMLILFGILRNLPFGPWTWLAP
jgi:hypothetical protein